MLMTVCPFLSSLRVLFLFLAFPRWLGEPVPSHTVGGTGGAETAARRGRCGKALARGELLPWAVLAPWCQVREASLLFLVSRGLFLAVYFVIESWYRQ